MLAADNQQKLASRHFCDQFDTSDFLSREPGGHGPDAADYDIALFASEPFVDLLQILDADQHRRQRALLFACIVCQMLTCASRPG